MDENSFAGIKIPMLNSFRRQRMEREKMEKATFAAGCFWGVEAEFRKMGRCGRRGLRVHRRIHKDPSYGDVCAGQTPDTPRS